MSNSWITLAEAVTIVSKNSHHPVSLSHVRTLVNRGKIGTRSSQQGTVLLKRSDVEATRVAVGTGDRHSTDIKSHTSTPGFPPGLEGGKKAHQTPGAASLKLFP